MEQLPPPTMVTVAPETVHTLSVFDVKLTGMPFGAPPDMAVALTVKGAAPNVTSGNAANVIVWSSLAIPEIVRSACATR